MKSFIMNLRPIAAVGLSLAVITSGTGAALAVGGQFSSDGNSASHKQYCPPSSKNGQGGRNGDNGKGEACGQQGRRPQGPKQQGRKQQQSPKQQQGFKGQK
jgi:hypothetical protein